MARNMITILKLFSLSSLLLPLQAYAANGWYDGLTVSDVVVEPGGPGFSVLTDGADGFCGTTGKHYFSFSGNRSEEMYSMALSAVVSGKTVRIYVDASKGCEKGGFVSTGIWIER